MLTFHPAFDPLTSTWFVNDIEASSLRELKKLLPRRAKLKGYFPNGYTAPRLPSSAPICQQNHHFIYNPNTNLQK